MLAGYLDVEVGVACSTGTPCQRQSSFCRVAALLSAESPFPRLVTQTHVLLCAAFDKGDLLYLRDEEEKRRFLEKDQRESERSQFLAMRAREMAERDASLPEAPRPSRDRPLIRCFVLAQAAATSLPSFCEAGQATLSRCVYRPKQMAAVIRVQPGQTTVRLGVSQGIAAHSSQEPAAKRHKAEAAGEKSHIQATPLSQAAPLPQTSQAASAQEVSLEGLLGARPSFSCLS